MNRVYFVLLITLFALPGVVFAQKEVFSKDPAAFGSEVITMMTATNNEEAIQVGNDFNVLWSGASLNTSHKSAIIEISQKMLKRNFKTKPHFEYFFESLIKAISEQQLDESEITNFLTVTTQVIDEYDNQNALQYLNTVNRFFKTNALYASSYNSVYAEGGTYSFEFVANEPAPEEELLQDTTEEADNEEGWFSDWDEEGEDDWSTSDWDNSGDWGDEKEADKEEEQQNALTYGMEEQQPEISGAVIKFVNAHLAIVNTFDSVALKNTSGSFMIRENLFVGEGGRFDWSNAGLSEDSVFADFSQYSFDVEQPSLTAENVKLSYYGKVKEPVEGVFEYRSERASSPNAVRYPRFKSYNNDIKVSNMGNKNLYYKGGFSLMGNKIYSSSVIEGPAIIEVRDKNGKDFKAISKLFNLQDSIITAERAAIVIYHSHDSIFHPAVQFKYQANPSLLTIVKDDGGFKDTPFYTSFYKMDIRADMIKWDLNADSLDISILNAKSQIPALFESQEYYKEEEFNKLTGIYHFHPLLMAVGYARKVRSSEFYADDMAARLNQKHDVIRGAMTGLMYKGFIDYDINSGLVKIKRKGFHYVMSKQKLKDYDNLLIASISPSQPNATLNLKTQELTIRGIDKFYISELLDVYIVPKGNEVTLLKNRDLLFNGQVSAGNFEYIGKEFRFDYDEFKIDLPIIDSLKFNIETEKVNRNNKAVKMQLSNQLRETSGVLYINKPENKSGQKFYAQYPVFSADKGAIVYFDSDEILDGAYDRSVYFSIPAFEIDSVSSSDPSVIGFEGTFVSGGIFPEFKQRLQVMPDNSLGFEHMLPYEGYDLYNGKGKAYNNITLDADGLRTSGKIDYLTSTLESENFVYYVDSVTTTGQKAVIRKGMLGKVSFPEAKLDGYEMKWLPKQDSMYISNLKKPFHLYDSTASFQGLAILSSKGMFGAGTLLTRGSEAISESFTFAQDNYQARHAKFEIKSSNSMKPALAGNDVRLHFNLTQNNADISPEVEGEAAIDFPYAQFKTSITKASWNLEDNKVRMIKPEDVPISNSYFYTTRKDLDSLAFNATNAIYDINQLQLNVYGIPYMKVADAKITPENNEVLILENAEFGRFENATIVLDTLNEYHRLFDGDIKVLSRNAFEGDATYQYVNSVSDTFAIKFGSFELVGDDKGKGQKHTVSSGAVMESDNIFLSPGLLYKGDVTMYADKQALELNGFIKLDLANIPNDTWIEYNSSSDDRVGEINIANSITEAGESLAAGLYFDGDTEDIYGVLLSEKKSPDDLPLFTSQQILSYDSTSGEYQVRKTLSSTGSLYTGKLFTYNEDSTDIRIEGPLTFTHNPNIGLKASGIGKGNLNKDTYFFNTFMRFNFDMPTDAADMMGMEIFDVASRIGAPPAEDNRTALLYKLSQIIGDEGAKEYEQRSLSNYTSFFEVSNELISPLVFSNVNMAWSKDHKAWYSSGKLGLASVIRTEVNAALDGFIEFRRGEEGDEVNVFVQASPSTWYFMSFIDNRLLIASSNEEFNTIISGKSKADKANIGEFAFFRGDIVDATKFINRFRKDYYDIDEPYKLNLPSENVVAEENEFKTIQETDEDEDAFIFDKRATQEDKKNEDDDADGF